MRSSPSPSPSPTSRGSPSPPPAMASSSPSSSSSTSKLRRLRSQASIPWPVPELLRSSEEPFSTAVWLDDLGPLLAKAAEWTVLYLIGLLGLGYAWVLLLALLYYLRYRETRQSLTDTIMARLSTLTTEPDVLGRSLNSFPSWVAFPDFDRAEFVNDILRQLWPSIGGYATTFVADFVEPEIRRILDSMKLETVSGFQFKKVDVGSIPARVGGIKVYSRNVDRGEIVLDVEVLYNGDARVLLSLQGIQAEVKNINFRGMARVTLKPVLRTFPFVGGLEVCFLNRPSLDYSLGGVGAFGEIPGANAVIKAIVEEQIRSRFVWPNRFRLYLPIELVQMLPDKSYLLMKPSGVLEVKVLEARDLLRMDKGLTGSGKSDPYAIVTVGMRKVSFRDRYVPKTINPKFDYSTSFEIEDPFGQEVKVELYDYDNSSSDDFLGSKILDLSLLVQRHGGFEEWVTLDGVSRGQVRLGAGWKEAVPLDDQDETDFDSFILSVFVDSCKNLSTGSNGKRPSPKCVLRHTQGEVHATAVRPKTRDPVFEESFTFPCRNLDTDNLSVEVVDARSSDARLGSVKVPLLFLKKSRRREFFTMEWKLDGSEDGCINLSAKLYGIYL